MTWFCDLVLRPGSAIIAAWDSTVIPESKGDDQHAPHPHYCHRQPVLLPDGRHPVRITTVDPDQRTITFDLIQFYWGDDATREAAKDHQESPPPNDYYIRNINPRLRTLPVLADAPITCNTLAAGYTGSTTKNIRLPLWRLAIVMQATHNSPPFWITVHHGQVARIAEQYLP